MTTDAERLSAIAQALDVPSSEISAIADKVIADHHDISDGHDEKETIMKAIVHAVQDDVTWATLVSFDEPPASVQAQMAETIASTNAEGPADTLEWKVLRYLRPALSPKATIV